MDRNGEATLIGTKPQTTSEEVRIEILRKSIHLLIALVPTLAWISTPVTMALLASGTLVYSACEALRMARFLWEAGVRPGSLVAVESSGSFPGFAIAALVASKSLGAKTVSVMSIGASTWGANRPGFTLPDMVYSLSKRGLLRVDRMAISPGGADDIGSDMDAQALGAALARVKAEGATLIDERDLGRDVAVKKAFLESRGKPAVLVSIGGNWAAAGPGEALLGRTGLLRASDFPGGVHEASADRSAESKRARPQPQEDGRPLQDVMRCSR